MSPLESRIRNLSLRPPGESLDARITAMFSSTEEPSQTSPAAGSLQEMDAAAHSRLSQSSKTSAWTGSRWLPACASLLIGTVVGRWLPFSKFDQQSGNRMASSAVTAGEQTQSGQDTVTNDQASGTVPVAFQGRERSSESSQIVESFWMSPTAAAVAWEQQTGQIFNVVNHVNDRRFDMCRDCHRVGG
jgi:hypothetical protein